MKLVVLNLTDKEGTTEQLKDGLVDPNIAEFATVRRFFDLTPETDPHEIDDVIVEMGAVAQAMKLREQQRGAGTVYAYIDGPKWLVRALSDHLEVNRRVYPVDSITKEEVEETQVGAGLVKKTRRQVHVGWVEYH